MPGNAKAASSIVPIEVTGTNKREKIKCITDRLEEGVRAVFSSDEYREYLDFLSRFHDYSFSNCILIKMQLPSASLVAGYGDWLKKHHRYVRPGEKGIKILAPTPYKWGIKSQTRYFKILQKADETKELSYSYYDGCLLDRNRYMVDRTGTLLAVYNGEYRGGPAATIRYARKLDREIIIIDPATGKISQDA